jgi:hypothetical protein
MMLQKLAAVGVAMVALAGCTGGGDDGADGAASRAAGSNHDAAVELAKCMRANGFPTFPDPVEDDRGRWNFPPEAVGDWQPAEACRPLVQAWKSAFAGEKARTPEEMAKLREYAKCMREQGLPDFPDPDDEGNLALPDRLRVLADNDDPAFTAAAEACAHLLPPKPTGKGEGS